MSETTKDEMQERIDAAIEAVENAMESDPEELSHGEWKASRDGITLLADALAAARRENERLQRENAILQEQNALLRSGSDALAKGLSISVAALRGEGGA